MLRTTVAVAVVTQLLVVSWTPCLTSSFLDVTQGGKDAGGMLLATFVQPVFTLDEVRFEIVDLQLPACSH